jgi:hypothetical protein
MLYQLGDQVERLPVRHPDDRFDPHKDPFAVQREFHSGDLSTLSVNLKKQKTFTIGIELPRQGFSYAGSAAAQGVLRFDEGPIGEFSHQNAKTSEQQQTVNSFRITINDRLEPKERFATLAHELGHIFCGHLVGCTAPGRDEDESGLPDRRSLGRDEKEIEAEAVAYVVVARGGLITRSAQYLKDHVQRAKIRDINVDLVVRAAGPDRAPRKNTLRDHEVQTIIRWRRVPGMP